MRRLRRKACVPVGVAGLTQRLPRESPSPSRVSVLIHCQGPRLDMNQLFHSLLDTDVVPTVASFLSIRALGRFLCLEKHVCGREGLWKMLLRRVGHSVFAVRVRSARVSISKMMRRPDCAWPAHWPAGARVPGVQPSNYRWCLDLCCRGYEMFSAVVPVTAPSAEDLGDFRSLLRGDSAGRQRVANLLPAHRLSLPVLELMDSVWNETTDPVLLSPGWSGDVSSFRKALRDNMMCSLWLFDIRSREVVTGICRDAHWGSDSGLFRFYISERFKWNRFDWNSDHAPNERSHMAGRVLEIWVPFRCTSAVGGTYDLSCSVEVFLAYGTLYPEPTLGRDAFHGCNPAEDPPLEWRRKRASTWDLKCALNIDV